MDNLFLALALISLFILLPIGLFKPSVFRLASRKIVVASFLGVTIFFLILFGITSNTSKTNNENTVSQTENKQSNNQVQTTTNPVGCVVANPTISYSLLKESTRESDVKNIPIKECYILIGKKIPTIAELTQLATVLGKNNGNIEFEIFDEPKAYTLYEKYIATHKEEDASNADWKFLYDHFLAWYLKANTHLSNNYLQPVGNAYYTKGQDSIPKILIVN